MSRAKPIIGATVSVVLVAHVGIALPYPIFAPMFLNVGAPFATSTGWFAELPPLYAFAILMAIYPLGTLFGSLILGSLSDRVGRPTVILATSLVAVFLNLLAAYAVFSEHYLLLCAARFLTGFCEGNIAVARAIVADLDLGNRKTATFGYLNSAGYAGYLTGPLIGAAFASWSFSLPFVVASLLTLLSAVICALFLVETGRGSAKAAPSKEALRSPPTPSVRLLKQPFFAQMLLIQFLVTFAINLYHEFFPVLMVEKWSASPLDIAIATITATSTMILVSVFGLGTITRHISLERLYGVSLLGLGTTLVGFTLPEQFLTIYAAFVLFGVALAMFNSSSMSYLSNVYARIPQGQLMGVFASAFFLSNIAAALFGGVMAQASVDLPMYVGAGLALLAALLFVHPARRLR